MNKKSSSIVLFVSIFLAFISFIALTVYLYPMVLLNKESIECSVSYSLECFILDLTLPIVVIVLLSLLIGFVARRVKR